MDIKGIVEKIPANVAGIFDKIFIITKDMSEFFDVIYNGDEIKVSQAHSFEEARKFINETTVENLKNGKDVVENSKDINNVIVVKNYDDYKLVLILKPNEVTSGDKLTLIIADDSPIITKFFAKIFSDEYNVLVASNGDEAIDLVNQNIDKNLGGVFLDLQMPGKNGFDVLKYFKENNMFDKVPVSIISGEDSADGIQEAMSYQIVDMIQKPFSQDTIKNIVEKTITSRK